MGQKWGRCRILSVSLRTEHRHSGLRDMIEKKRFCFFLYPKFAKIFLKERAVTRRLDLSYIHSRQGNIDIRSRRGSGLFISGRAFGDASDKINCTSSCAFFMPAIECCRSGANAERKKHKTTRHGARWQNDKG